MSERLPRSVYLRRRLLVAGGVAGLAVTAWLGPEIVDAVHDDSPIPAGCTTRVRDGQDYWTIADMIDEQTRDETGEIAWKLGRTNPDLRADELQAGQPIGVPDEYCPIVEQPDFNRQ